MDQLLWIMKTSRVHVPGILQSAWHVDTAIFRSGRAYPCHKYPSPRRLCSAAASAGSAAARRWRDAPAASRPSGRASQRPSHLKYLHLSITSGLAGAKDVHTTRRSPEDSVPRSACKIPTHLL